MNDRKQNHVGTMGRLLLLTVLACFGLAAAQGPVKKKEPGTEQKITTGAPACSADDKVAVTAFSLSPTQARMGQSVTAKMTIKKANFSRSRESITSSGKATPSNHQRLFFG